MLHKIHLAVKNNIGHINHKNVFYPIENTK